MSVWERERKVRSSCTQAVCWLFSCLQLLTQTASNNVRFFLLFFVRFCILKFFAPSATTWILTDWELCEQFFDYCQFLFLFCDLWSNAWSHLLLLLCSFVFHKRLLLLSFLCENCVSKFVVVYDDIIHKYKSLAIFVFNEWILSHFCHLSTKGDKIIKLCVSETKSFIFFCGKIPLFIKLFLVDPKESKVSPPPGPLSPVKKLFFDSIIFLCLQTHTKSKIKILTLLKKWKISAAF